MPAANSAFISYRRDPAYAAAKLIWRGLRDLGIDAFLDLEGLDEAGAFDVKVLNQIAGRPYFVVVLTEGTLDRCLDDGDWLWRELDHALGQRRIVVPAIIPPFDFDDADRFLPSSSAAAALKAAQGVSFPPEYFDDAIERLASRLQPVDLAGRPLSDEDHEFAHRAAVVAERASVEVEARDQPPQRQPETSATPNSSEYPVRSHRGPYLVAVVAALCLLVVLALAAWRVIASDVSSSPSDTVTGTVSSNEAQTARHSIEEFDGEFGVVVESGGSDDGAGEIASPGQVDVYGFAGVAGQQVFVDVRAFDGVTCQAGGVESTDLVYELVAPDGSQLVEGGSNYLAVGGRCVDAGPIELPLDGRYELRVGALFIPTDAVATYAIAMWDAPREEFDGEFGVVVESGGSDDGAGEIASPGQVDVYGFAGVAGQQVFVDVRAFDGVTCQAGGVESTDLVYELVAPDGSQLVEGGSNYLAVGGRCVDAGPIELPLDGRYELRVGALFIPTDAVASYAIAMWDAPREEFDGEFGVVVESGGSDGVGEIASPGQVDVYGFAGVAGQQVFVDVRAFDGVTCQAGGVESTDLVYELVAPDGSQLVEGGSNYLAVGGRCVDAGPIELPLDGRYELRVGALFIPTDAVATYAIAMWDAPREEFDGEFGVVVESGGSDDGAGEIASPGQVDVYGFAGVAGQQVFVDVRAFDGVTCQAGGVESTDLVYELVAPDGSQLVEGGSNYLAVGGRCVDAGPIELPLDGRYELRVGALFTPTDAVASYAIVVATE